MTLSRKLFICTCMLTCLEPPLPRTRLFFILYFTKLYLKLAFQHADIHISISNLRMGIPSSLGDQGINYGLRKRYIQLSQKVALIIFAIYIVEHSKKNLKQFQKLVFSSEKHIQLFSLYTTMKYFAVMSVSLTTAPNL